MGWLRKKSDPISERARALTQEIAALEAQIKSLDNRLQRQQEVAPDPADLSSAGSPPATGIPPNGDSSTPPIPRSHEPIFEEVDRGRLKSKGEAADTPEHYNDLGVRKYDLPGLWRRFKSYFQGPSTTNPKLVSYLAAGGIQGFRPLRYEKRVARNRFIALAIFLFIVLLGLLAVYVRR